MNGYFTVRAKALFLTVGFFLVGIGLMFFAGQLQQGVREGLSLCARVVIPALFVYLCLCYWLTETQGLSCITRLLRPLFRVLLGNSWQGGAALLMAVMGGYPMGAAVLKRLYDSSALSARQVRYLCLGLFCPSPAFAVSAVGVGLLSSPLAGLLLWIAATVPVLIITVALGRLGGEALSVKEEAFPHQGGFSSAMAGACRSMLYICGVVVLCRAIASVLQGLPFPSIVIQGLSALLEVTNGCVILSPYGLPWLAAVLGFGGIGTHLQIKGLLGGLMPSYPIYFGVRLLQGAAAYGMTFLLAKWCSPVLPTLWLTTPPAVGSHSVLPSVAVVLTCFVFLGWLEYANPKRKVNNEKPRIYQ